MQLALARAWVARTADGPLDDERIAACSNLSTALTDTVQYDEAMATLQRLQAVLDRNDPRWIRCMSKIARILIHRGLYDQAEALCRPLLAGRSDDADCETCILRSYLAVAMMHQRQHAEAEDILRRVLDVLTRTRGPEHHETLSVADYLAQCLYFQDRREKKAQAANLQRELLLVQARVRGPDHPATLNTLNNLGCSLFELGEFDEAARLAEEAYAKRRRVLGAEHPHTLSTMTILAPILVEVGQPERAVDVLRACLEARRRLLGPDHADTIATSMELQDIVAATRRARRSARGHGTNERVSHAQADATSTTRHCHASGCRSEGVTRMCGRCGRVGYCSRECQVADWRSHKPDCARAP
jgi:tetratricopeptide (TPR) repeat protein